MRNTWIAFPQYWNKDAGPLPAPRKTLEATLQP